MTTPIKPMSAEDATEQAIKVVSAVIEALTKADVHPEIKDEIRLAVKEALASHLAYVKEKMPEEWRWAHGDDCSHYENKCDVKDGSLEYNEALNACRAVLQSEIDELTK